MNKRKITARIPETVAEGMQRAAYWLRVPLEKLYADAAESHLRQLQAKHNEGKEFAEKVST